MRILDVRLVADVLRGGAGHHHGVAGGEDVGLVGADAHHLRVVVADGLQAGIVLILLCVWRGELIDNGGHGVLGYRTYASTRSTPSWSWSMLTW